MATHKCYRPGTLLSAGLHGNWNVTVREQNLSRSEAQTGRVGIQTTLVNHDVIDRETFDQMVEAAQPRPRPLVRNADDAVLDGARAWRSFSGQKGGA